VQPAIGVESPGIRRIDPTNHHCDQAPVRFGMNDARHARRRVVHTQVDGPQRQGIGQRVMALILSPLGFRCGSLSTACLSLSGLWTYTTRWEYVMPS
jgi:hypothetical protein